jgi:hypothetical protein
MGEAIRDQFPSPSCVCGREPELSFCVCVCAQVVVYICASFFFFIFLPFVCSFSILALRKPRLASPERTQSSGIENTDAKASGDIESTCFAIHPLFFSPSPLVDSSFFFFFFSSTRLSSIQQFGSPQNPTQPAHPKLVDNLRVFFFYLVECRAGIKLEEGQL